MSRILLLLVSLALVLKIGAHPVHVSICNLEIDNKKLTISLKLFKDDFQLALQHNYGKIIALEDLTLPEHKSTLDNYINEAFSIELNKNNPLRLNYIRTKINEEAIWLYYSYDLENLRKLKIVNALLLDIYSDQTNLVIINHNGKQKGYRFNMKNYQQIIDLK